MSKYRSRSDVLLVKMLEDSKLGQDFEAWLGDEAPKLLAQETPSKDPKDAYAVHDLHFYRAAESFRGAVEGGGKDALSGAAAVQEAEKLFSRYLATDAAEEVALDEVTREAIELEIKYKTVGPRTFALAAEKIYQRLKLEVFPLFLSAPEFHRMLRSAQGVKEHCEWDAGIAPSVFLLHMAVTLGNEAGLSAVESFCKRINAPGAELLLQLWRKLRQYREAPEEQRCKKGGE
eukprot:scaffold2275_cov245-Pinguiococcus_pyrenoidosus.AAC.12